MAYNIQNSKTILICLFLYTIFTFSCNRYFNQNSSCRKLITGIEMELKFSSETVSMNDTLCLNLAIRNSTDSIIIFNLDKFYWLNNDVLVFNNCERTNILNCQIVAENVKDVKIDSDSTYYYQLCVPVKKINCITDENACFLHCGLNNLQLTYYNNLHSDVLCGYLKSNFASISLIP